MFVEPTIKPVNLLGVRFIGYDKQALLTALEDRVNRRHKALVLSGNAHAFNLAYSNRWLHDLFNRADYIRIDGVGPRLGARLLGSELPPRTTWADFIWDLAAFAEPRGLSFFFLGARPGVAEAAAEKLRERYSGLKIAGIHHGYFSGASQDTDNETVLAHIGSCRPDILLVGMGMPVQERWIHDNWERIEATVTMTAGAVFDYTAGQLRRPPEWLRRNGFEWLGRMIIEPRRLWHRYLVGNPLFLWRTLRQKMGANRNLG